MLPLLLVEAYVTAAASWSVCVYNLWQLDRSIFFHLGLKFKKEYPAVLDATKTGGVDVRIRVPQQIAHDTAFLYQLRFSEKAKAQELEYNGAKLDRFVYQSMHDNEVRSQPSSFIGLQYIFLQNSCNSIMKY